jgi:hypothetical protein
MTKSISLDALWASATPTELIFSSDRFSHAEQVICWEHAFVTI